MNSPHWPRLIEALPPNLTVDEVSQIFRRSANLVRRRLREHKYRYRTERKLVIPEWVAKADWSRSNSEIGAEANKSRERVRQWRNILGKPKVESRGRKRMCHVRTE